MKLIFVNGTVFNLEQIVRVVVATRTATFSDGSTHVFTVQQFARLRLFLEVRSIEPGSNLELLD